MNRNTQHTLLALLLGAACLMAIGCTGEESELGINLVDSNLTYSGQRATLDVESVRSVRDDSLLTTNYSYGTIGRYSDATYGSVSSTLYTQIALPADNTDIGFDNMVIDSVVLMFHKSIIYPDTSRTYHFHIEVMQLDEVLLKDTAYYSTDTLKVDPSARYFDADITVAPTDSTIRLKLDNSITHVLNHNATADEFLQYTKGLRIRTTAAGDEGMIGIDFTHTDTRLDVYYRTNATDVNYSTYRFPLGGNACRFMHFEHDYTNSPTAGADSIDGGQVAYLEPLGGYNILLSFDNAVRTFLAAHPMATIHQAELLLPVSSGADNRRPERILALTTADNGNRVYINDLTDLYTVGGFDGKYDESRGCYRLRTTQHVQNMLRQGEDKGTLLVLNARRYEAARTVINGSASSNPIRIELVYTE